MLSKKQLCYQVSNALLTINLAHIYVRSYIIFVTGATGGAV